MNSVLEIENIITPDTPGINHQLNNGWVLWLQINKGNQACCKFYTIAGFWALCDVLKYKTSRFIIMREFVVPSWESQIHIDGCYYVITLKYPFQDVYKIFLNCVMGLVGENLFDKYDTCQITGITYINDPQLKQIRFWCKSEYPDFDDLSTDYKKIFNKYRITSDDACIVSFQNLKKKN